MERRLAAILAADIVGYSRLMESDETETLNRQTFHRDHIIRPLVEEHSGRIFKLMGDGLLVEFSSVIDAVNCAVGMQQQLTDKEAAHDDGDRIKYRIGINSGDVVIDGDDVYGDGVNIAARLESLARPGGICISGAAYEQMRSKVDLDFELVGEVAVKNIKRKIQAYNVLTGSEVADEAAATTGFVPKATRPRYSIAAVVFGIVLIVGGATLWFQRGEAPPGTDNVTVNTGPSPASIAVLPLDDLSVGANRGYLSDALSEGIIAELARYPEFRVIARNSSFQFRDDAVDIRKIQEELGVDYVIEGSQQYDGEQVRVTVQLIETDSGTHIFTERLDRQLDDLFQIQDEIVGHVVARIGDTVLNHIPTKRSEKEVDSVLRSMQARKVLRNFSRENWEKALEIERTSIREDPEAPWGYIGTALGLRTGAFLGWIDRPRDEVLAEAAGYSEKALAIAPDNYMSHYAHARVLANQGEIKKSLLHYERAAELNPSATNVLIGMAIPLLYEDNTDRAIEVLQKAKAVDPLHGNYLRHILGWAYWQNNECEKGRDAMLAMARVPPNSMTMLAALYVCVGNTDKAKETMAAFLEKVPDRTVGVEAKRVAREWTDKAIQERWLSNMREAGMPE